MREESCANFHEQAGGFHLAHQHVLPGEKEKKEKRKFALYSFLFSFNFQLFKIIGYRNFQAAVKKAFSSHNPLHPSKCPMINNEKNRGGITI